MKRKTRQALAELREFIEELAILLSAPSFSKANAARSKPAKKPITLTAKKKRKRASVH